MEMTGPAISRVPLMDAWNGVRPLSICRWMFSTTTIASSTTRPMANAMARSVRRLMLKPRASRAIPMPTSDNGIVTMGMTTDRTEPRKRKITTSTISVASTIVVSTSWIEAVMKIDESYRTVVFRPAGRLASRPGSSARMSRTTLTGLAPGVVWIVANTACHPTAIIIPAAWSVQRQCWRNRPAQ